MQDPVKPGRSSPATTASPEGGLALLAAWCPCEPTPGPPPSGEILVRRVAGLGVCRNLEHF